LALVGVALVVASGFQLAAPMIRSAEAPHGRALPPPSPVPTASPSGPAVASASPPPPPPVVSDPVRLRIPAIALDAPVIDLGLDPQGAIDVPTQWGDVGWYKPGVAPGAVGPAVLVGHYDSKTGPAVFYRLGSVLPGDQLDVVGASGARVTFVVDRLQEVSKATFPAQEVYGPVTRPEIRLITCDGAFDEHTHHYVDNLVVYGHAISVPAAAPSVVPAPLATVPVSLLPAPAVPSATVPARSNAVPAPPAAAPTGTPAASLGSVIPLPLASPPAAIPAATHGFGPAPAPRTTPAPPG
jgi:sortase (surface protein transpeptidase)